MSNRFPGGWITLTAGSSFVLIIAALSTLFASGAPPASGVISISNGISASAAVPWLISLATLGVGFWQFSRQQKQTNRQAFLQKQLDLCIQASDIAARLASEPDPDEWEKARIIFWRLYWGPLSMVENPAVETAMVKLGQVVPPEKVDSNKMLEAKALLKGPSYRLAHAARDLVLDSWQVKLPALQGMKPDISK
jgi:hypothetical protein